MKLSEFQKVQAQVTLFTGILLAAASLVLARLGRVSAVSLILMVLSALFMVAHWWLLGGLVAALVECNRTSFLVRGMLSVFPAGAALAVLYVSIRLGRESPLPVLLGILSVPAAVTLVCLGNGLASMRTALAAEGPSHG